MGRIGFHFYVNPHVDRDAAGNLVIVTPHRLTFHHGNRWAVIEPRLPSKGERTWQCWVTNPLAADMREMIGDWGADGPGWEATGDEENDKEHEDGAAYHVTIIAAFELIEEMTVTPIITRMMSHDEIMKEQGFKPGAEAKSANARDAIVNPDLDAARRACNPDPDRKSFVTIELEISGGHVAAERAVEAALDEGTLQDAINDYDGDAPVKVRAATIVRGAS